MPCSSRQILSSHGVDRGADRDTNSRLRRYGFIVTAADFARAPCRIDIAPFVLWMNETFW
jgi:hypothetical protein